MESEKVIKKLIGRGIYQFREQNKMSRVKFMQRLGEIPVSLENIENGRSYPSMDFVIQLANEFHVMISDVIDTGFKMDSIDFTVEQYQELDLYYILQKVSLEKYTGLQERDCRDFLSVKIVESNWSFMGNLLHNERIKRRYSFAELAERTGVKIGTLKNIESGSNSSSFQFWYQICSALRIPLDYFFANQLKYKQGALNYLLQDIFADTTNDDRRYLLQYMKLFGDKYIRK